ncbi:uncharacterized protein LOC126838790 [Adelges cooleyi]|uniref:uncharacterized protein LOC126838790 n=1 Tax=Adelges cooleyi TaxID=133065 RepID=UPI00217FCF06|nr:uncharacterized protein LOC126838790 [Adelges cooleyi]
MDSNDLVFNTIFNNEVRLEKPLGLDRPGSSLVTGSYNTAVMKRRNLINSAIFYTLNDSMKNVQMCVNGESMKCALITLIEGTPYYQFKHKYRCAHKVYCIITLTVAENSWVNNENIQWTETLTKTFRDQSFDVVRNCYKIFFENPETHIFTEWTHSKENIVESFVSDGE